MDKAGNSEGPITQCIRGLIMAAASAKSPEDAVSLSVAARNASEAYITLKVNGALDD